MEKQNEGNSEISSNSKADESSGNIEPEVSIWKRIAVLHTSEAWTIFVIMTTVTVQSQLTLYDISFRKRTAFSLSSLSDFANVNLAMDCVYAFDVLSAIIYKRWTSLSSTYGQPTRPAASLIVDIISLIPLNFIYILIASESNLRVYHFMSMNHLLRIYRLFSFFNATRNTVGKKRIYIGVIEFLVFLFLMSETAVAVMTYTVDMVNLNLNWLKIIQERSSYPETEFEWCIISYYVMISLISGHGLPEVHTGMDSFAFVVIVLLSLWVLQAFEIAYLTDMIVQRDYNRSLFNREMNLIEKYLNDMDAAKRTREKVKKYYNYFWKTQGNSEFKIMSFHMFPPILLKECALELTWDTFKHSHLFRDQPIPFLRNLAIRFEREYYRPGEVIIEKYDQKSKMIYVVTGVVQFLSEEDDESPILSLSGGTILCESTLILSHRSLCNVVARTEVELNVLHWDKFTALMVYRYQDIYRVIQSRIRFRYWKAVRMATIGTALQKKQSHIANIAACTDVAWLKQTLRVLQNRFNRNISKKERKDLHVDTIFATTDFRYTFANLDMLVISDDFATVTEQVCYNNGRIPWIFYPESTIIKSWKGFVLVCCLSLTVIIPMYATTTKYRGTELSLVLDTLCLVYLLDLIITSSTAIHEHDEVLTNVVDIIAKRMYDVSYWADIVAAFPVDWVMSLFGLHQARMVAYGKINRLVKMYRFEKFFAILEDRMNLSMYKIRVIKYTFYLTILIYLSSACILLVTCPNDQCDSAGSLLTFLSNANDDFEGMQEISALLYASQIIIGIGTNIIAPKLFTEYFVSICLLVLGAAVSNYVISSVAASQILGGYTKSWLRFNTMNIALMLNVKQVSKSIQKRVFCYVEMEWLDNSAYVLTFEREVFDTATPKLRKELNAERLMSLLSDVKLFQDIEEECLKQICSVCKLVLLPPQEVVGYRGSECRAMYIVEKGHCLVWRNDMKPMNVEKGKALYVLETLYDIEHLHTVTTVTYVCLVKIKLMDLMHALSQFPMQKTIMTKILNNFKNSPEYSKLLNILASIPKQDMTKELDEMWQIEGLTRARKNPNKQERYKGTAKDVPEKRYWNETILTLFLLKSTIDPDGRFLKIWEGLRCTCGYLLIIFYSLEAVFSHTISNMFRTIVSSVLNCIMVIDLYVRLHVQFYNAEKVLVTHSFSTAKNYIRTGLIVDVVAVFPFEYFFITGGDHNIKERWLCRLNRLLMTHRIIGAVRHCSARPYMSKYINCVMFLPMILLTGHVFACGLLLELCDFGKYSQKSENYESGIYCSPKNVELSYESKEPITALKMYIYAVLYVFGTLTKIGTVNLKPITYTAILYVLVMSFVNFLMLMVVTTYIVSTISRRDVALTAYQKQMKIMTSYLKKNKVSTQLQDEMVNYFESFWILKGGTSILKQLHLFPSALQEDVLWCVYGPTLTKSPGFSKRSESFFRSLFSHMKIKFYSKGAEVMSVNLVHHLVIFIHWGWIEAFGPDGTKLAILGSGSIFGNFTSSGSMRQTCRIVSDSHCETLVIESTDFFNVMMRHPRTRKSFLAAAALSTDFLRAESKPEEVEVLIQANKEPSSFILLPNTPWIRAWKLFSLLFGCYLPFVLCLYHSTVKKFTGLSIMVLYTVDFVFVVKLVLVFFTAFEDHAGNYVRDTSEIAKRFRKGKLGLYFHLFTMVPLELFSVLMTNFENTWNSLAWLNRVPRLILVTRYFQRACNRLNINTSIMRMCYSGMLFLSLLHGAACLTLMVEKLAAIEDDAERPNEFEAYVKKFYITSAIFTAVSSRDRPKNIPEALSFIILYLVFYFAHATLIGEVCAVVDTKQLIMNEYERAIVFFNERVHRMDLTYALRSNAWRYGSELWKIRSGQQRPHLIKEGPNYVQRAVASEMYSHHLLDNEIFGSLHKDFIRQLTYHFRESLYFPGDRIVNVNDIDETIYFIREGTVQVSSAELVESEKAELGPTECFGLLQGLYEKMPHTATYTAKTMTYVISLYRPHWIYLSKYFPASTVNLYTTATEIIRASGLEAHT